jgi:hypothetical protein
MSGENNTQDPTMNPDDLYREETFTDRRIGTIRRMTPVTRDAEVDTTRPVLYQGQTQIMSPAGALPIGFEIEAESLGEAAEKFAAGAHAAIEQTMQEIEKMRREQASSIVMPGAGGLPPEMGAGKIQIP